MGRANGDCCLEPRLAVRLTSFLTPLRMPSRPSLSARSTARPRDLVCVIAAGPSTRSGCDIGTINYRRDGVRLRLAVASLHVLDEIFFQQQQQEHQQERNAVVFSRFELKNSAICQSVCTSEHYTLTIGDLVA